MRKDAGADPEARPQELEGYLGCGLLCRGFARLLCEGTEHTPSRACARSSLGMSDLG